MKRASAADVLLVLAFACLLAAGAYRVRYDRSNTREASPPALVAGDRLPYFWRDLAWSDPPDGAALVIFYTSECPYCRISVPGWNRLETLATELPGTRLVAVGLSDSAASLSYPGETGLRYSVHVPSDGAALEEKWKVRAVPYTIVLRRDGTVAGAWTGVVNDALYEEVTYSLRTAGGH